MKINPYNQSRKLVIGRILSIHTILVLFFPLIIAPRIQSFCSLKFVYRDFPNRQTTIFLIQQTGICHYNSFSIYPQVNGKKSNFSVPVCTNPYFSYQLRNTIFSSTIPMFILVHPSSLALSKECSNNE